MSRCDSQSVLSFMWAWVCDTSHIMFGMMSRQQDMGEHTPACASSVCTGKTIICLRGCVDRQVMDEHTPACVLRASLLLQAVDEQAGQGLHRLAQPPADALHPRVPEGSI